MEDKIYVVKAFGSGAHIVLPISMLGKKVRIIELKE